MKKFEEKKRSSSNISKRKKNIKRKKRKNVNRAYHGGNELKLKKEKRAKSNCVVDLLASMKR